MTPRPPRDVQRWLDDRALTAIPIAAAELLDKAIDIAQELTTTRHELTQLVRRESDTPLGDLLRLRDHQADLLRDVHERATHVIEQLQRGQQAEDAHRAWRQAVYRYERRTP